MNSMNHPLLRLTGSAPAIWPGKYTGDRTAAVLPQLRRIGVFRARRFGDLLCATPVLRALAAAWPKARITLIGLPEAEGLAQRLSSIDDFELFPGWPGLPGVPSARADEYSFFRRRMRSRRFDLVVQLHDSGRNTNALVAGFGARRNAGFADNDDWVPEADAMRFVQWPGQGSEVFRLLALTDFMGLPRMGLKLDLPLNADDRARTRPLLPANRRYAIVHPGARLASRRWSARGFAAVADRLAQAGLDVVLTGSDEERALVASVAGHMRHPALDLSGRTDIWMLGAALASASVAVCNNTVVSMMAAALGTRSVVASQAGEVDRGPPLDPLRHRVFIPGDCADPAGLLAQAALELADQELA
ncbi:glycosyltransferase family 9 protein [Delftia tsuruhatensis]